MKSKIKHGAEKKVYERKCTNFHNTRYIVLILAFFGIAIISILGNTMNIVIIAMVNMTSETATNMTVTSNCLGQLNETSVESTTGDFHWNTAQQGLILGCMYYGSSMMNIPGAWLAQKLGPKRVIGYSLLVCGVLTILSPITALISFELFVALRIILGVLAGIAYSSVIGIWNDWAPTTERTFFLSVTLAGNSFGFVLSLSVVGYIADNVSWQMTFYATGSFILFWIICWLFLMYDSPSQHPWISEKENEYINTSIGKRKSNQKKIETPWVSIFTSIPMWSIVCAHFASNWGEYTATTLLPLYMYTQLNFNLTSIGLLISLPYILQLIVALIVGYVTDAMRKNKIITTIAIRKINTAIGLLLPAAFGILAVYIGCNKDAAVACFYLSISISTFVASGFKASTADIAPRFGGITYAMSNTFAVIPGFLVPQIGGMILLNGNGRLQWKMIFWISASLQTLGVIIFTMFGSAEEQSWAKADKDEIHSALTIEADLLIKEARQNCTI